MIREAVTEYLRQQDIQVMSESEKVGWNFKCVLFDMDGVLYDSDRKQLLLHTP